MPSVAILSSALCCSKLCKYTTKKNYANVTWDALVDDPFKGANAYIDSTSKYHGMAGRHMLIFYLLVIYEIYLCTLFIPCS